MKADDTKGIKQRAGFIAAETRRSAEFVEKAKVAREQGRETRARQLEGRAATLDRRIIAAAENIKKLSS